MKRMFLIAVAALVMYVPISSAQTHSVVLSFTASPTTGIAGYHIYRAPCTGTVSTNLCSAAGTYAIIGTNTATTLTYTDTTVAAGAQYAYYVTAYCPPSNCSATLGGESGPSNIIGLVIPLNPPLPPGNLAITSVARNITTSGNTTVVATWQAVPYMPTTYTFYGNGQVLTHGTLKDASGIYTATWTGRIGDGASVSFEVCTGAGQCSSKLI